MSKKEKKITSKELKKILTESSSTLEHWFRKSKKYDPSHMASDRIKAEINRLTILQNQIRLELTIRRINRFGWYISIALIGIFFSFLAKPKFLFELTFNNTLLLTIIAAVGAIGGTLVRLKITKSDREAKRKHDIEQAKFASAQTKKIQEEINQLKNKEK